MSELATVLPTHRNPGVREAALPALEGTTNVVVTEPMPYGEYPRMYSVANVRLTGPTASPATIAPASASWLPLSRRSASTIASVTSLQPSSGLDD